MKLSLPDEGFVIDNILDPNQSWMYRTSELLYFWRDPRHENLIIVVTLNRRNTPSTGSFSASIFRLRGNESVRIFLRRARHVFARLSDRSTPKISLKKSATSEQLPLPSQRSRDHPKSKEQSSPSSPTTTSSQAEFDPRRLTTNGSSFDLYNRRTYSETTLSSENRISPSKRLNSSHLDDDDKLTTISNQFANEYIGELVQELKELRTEMIALKLTRKPISVRSTSTSPIVFHSEKSYRGNSSLATEVDAQTQTDHVHIDQSNGISSTNERNINGNQRIFPATNGHDVSQNNSKIYENLPTIITRKSVDKDPVPIPIDTESSHSTPKGEVVSFRSSLENTIAPSENIYENIPIFLPSNSNAQSPNKPYLRVTVANDPNAEIQQQYLTHLFGPQNGISSLLPPAALVNQPNSSSSMTKTTLPNSQYLLNQVSFSNQLTNPLFKTDKQLLANTIANQFGLDIQSPELGKLISNQHLFANSKRTFANVIWPITAEEETILCSSPTSTTPPQTIDIQTNDSNGSTGKSILKPKNSSRIPLKGPRITWDLSLE